MTVVGTIELLAKINTSDYKKGEKEIDAANKNIEKSTKKSSKAADESFAKFVGNISKMAAVAGAAVAAGFGVAVKSVANLEQSLGGSEVVFGKYASKIQTIAKGSFKTMGTDMNQFLETANKMGSLFQGAGFDIQKSTNITIAAMQRATDVATAMGISTDMALESIAGAAKGNFTMMDNLGVAMNDTAIGAYALSKGIEKSTQEMTTGEKVALAMELFMKRTAKYAGNYARENATLAGSFQTLRGAWGNFMSGVEGSDKQLSEAIVNMMKVLATNVPKIAAQMGKLLTNLTAEFLNSDGIKDYVTVIKQVATVITILLIPAMVKYIALQTAAGFSALVAGGRMAAGWLLALGPIGLLISLIGVFASIVIMNFDTISQVVSGVFTSIGKWGADTWKSIQKVFSVVGKWFGDMFRGAWTQIKGAFSAVKPFFSGLWKSIVSIFGNIGKAIGNAIGGAFKGVINGIIKFVESTVNGVIKSINSVAEGIDEALPGDQSGWRVPEVNLPRLAKGGIVSSATIAMIGEGSEPEAVIPLSKLDKMLDGTTNNNNSSSVTINLTGVFATSKQEQRKVAEQIAERLEEVQKSRALKPSLGVAK